MWVPNINSKYYNTKEKQNKRNRPPRIGLDLKVEKKALPRVGNLLRMPVRQSSRSAIAPMGQ